MTTATKNARQMPLYQCHKKVRALKIAAIEQSPVDEIFPGGSYRIVPADESFEPFTVAAEFVAKHNPEVGGYFVQYDDGYKSFSPAKAFEDGYTLISPRTVLDTQRMCLPGSEPLA